MHVYVPRSAAALGVSHVLGCQHASCKVCLGVARLLCNGTRDAECIQGLRVCYWGLLCGPYTTVVLWDVLWGCLGKECMHVRAMVYCASEEKGMKLYGGSVVVGSSCLATSPGVVELFIEQPDMCRGALRNYACEGCLDRWCN
jgi:hypothetical protein